MSPFIPLEGGGEYEPELPLGKQIRYRAGGRFRGATDLEKSTEAVRIQQTYLKLLKDRENQEFKLLKLVEQHEKYEKRISELFKGRLGQMKSIEKVAKDLGAIVRDGEVHLENFHGSIREFNESIKKYQSGQALTDRQHQAIAAVKLAVEQQGTGTGGGGVIGGITHGMGHQGRTGGIKDLFSDVFIGSHGAHLGLGGLWNLARAHPITAGIATAAAEFSRLTGINLYDPLGTYRETTGLGRLTGEGFGAGISTRMQGLRLGANPFDLISAKMAQEIAMGVRQRGFRGKVSNALTESIGSVVNTLGIEWKDALAPLDETLRRSSGGLKNFNENLSIVTGQLTGLKDIAKQGELSIPMQDLVGTLKQIQDYLAETSPTGTMTGALGTESALTSIFGANIKPEKIQAMFGDKRMAGVYAAMGGDVKGTMAPEFVVGGFMKFAQAQMAATPNARAYNLIGSGPLAALRDAGVGYAEAKRILGPGGQWNQQIQRAGGVSEFFAEHKRTGKLGEENIPDAFKKQFANNDEAYWSIEGMKRFLSGQSKQFPTRFFSAWDEMSVNQKEDFAKNIDVGDKDIQNRLSSILNMADRRRQMPRGAPIGDYNLPTSESELRNLVTEYIKHSTADQKKELVVTWKGAWPKWFKDGVTVDDVSRGQNASNRGRPSGLPRPNSRP